MIDSITAAFINTAAALVIFWSLVFAWEFGNHGGTWQGVFDAAYLHWAEAESGALERKRSRDGT